jgi:addiction module RelE/StbE family toxin
MHEIRYIPEVVKDQIPRLSLPVRNRIKKAIEKKLAIDPIAFGKPLRYSLKGLRRLRVDDYRVIYKVDENDLKVIIVKIAHRKEVYED